MYDNLVYTVKTILYIILSVQSLYIIVSHYKLYLVTTVQIIEGSLEVKLPTIWTDEKQRWEESEKRREE